MAARELPEKFLVAFSFAGEQRTLVRSIANALEGRLGFSTVFFDEWFESFLAGDDADIKLQKLYSDQCELAVVCVSKPYGEKPWTKAEHRAVRARMLKLLGSEVKSDKYRMLPIRVGEGDIEGLLFNAIVPDVCTRSAVETAQLIIDRLLLIIPDLKESTDQSATQPTWVDTPPRPLQWPMADHNGVRDAFAALLTHNTALRFLPLQGPTETGKSHVTRQMLANALQVPELACGRFDFKGTTNMDGELRAFVQDLGVPLPPASPRLNDRLASVLDALKRRARPALLVFDTYEGAGEAQDWIERQLLPSLVRLAWLRVVIAGQRVPPVAGAVWASAASSPLPLLPPPPADWLDYGKRYHPNLTLADVELFCRHASNKASLLAQLLGPPV